jgi:hypothetical protein
VPLALVELIVGDQQPRQREVQQRDLVRGFVPEAEPLERRQLVAALRDQRLALLGRVRALGLSQRLRSQRARGSAGAAQR